MQETRAYGVFVPAVSGAVHWAPGHSERILFRAINSTTECAPYMAFFAPPGCNSEGELVRYRSLLATAERYRMKA